MRKSCAKAKRRRQSRREDVVYVVRIRVWFPAGFVPYGFSGGFPSPLEQMLDAQRESQRKVVKAPSD